MTYKITLLEADIRDPMDGTMSLGLSHKGEQKATLEYTWDAGKFSAVFHGHAPGLPVPAHPTVLLQRPIAALYALKTDAHRLITDVFQDHQITIELSK
ncbi:MAG: hypothetical protein KUG69_14010 [Marinosulfonomonas sp.]|nr:hypothetical protein [Marinosulfonomonas sp.]